MAQMMALSLLCWLRLSGWQRTAPGYEMAQSWGTSWPSHSLIRLSEFTRSCFGTRRGSSS